MVYLTYARHYAVVTATSPGVIFDFGPGRGAEYLPDCPSQQSLPGAYYIRDGQW